MIVTGFYALKKQPGLFALCLAMLIASSLLIWLFGFYRPVFMFRTLLWGTLITSIVAGIGIAQFTPRFSDGIIFLFILLGMINTYSYFESNRAEQENWRGAASYLDRVGQASDTYIFAPDFVIGPFIYYANYLPDNDRIYGYEGERSSMKRADFQFKNDSMRRGLWEPGLVTNAAAISGERLWLISRHSNVGNINDAATVTREILEAGYKNTDYRRFRRIAIIGFQKTAR